MKYILAFLLLASSNLSATCSAGVDDNFLTANSLLGNCGTYTMTQTGAVPLNTTPIPPVGTHQAGEYSGTQYLQAPSTLHTAFRGRTLWSIQGYIYFNSLNNLTSTFFSFGKTTDQTHLYLVRALSSGALRMFVDGANTDSATGIVTTATWYYIAVVSDGANVKLYVSPASAITSTAVISVVSSATLRSDINYISLGDDISGVAGVTDCPLAGYLNSVTFFSVAITSFPTSPGILKKGGASKTQDQTRR